MRILLTGSCGFLGKHVHELLEKRHDVLGFDNRDSRCGSSDEPCMLGDVSKYSDVELAACELKTDTIIHLAGYGRNLTCQAFPQDAWRTNVWGTRNVLMVADKYRDIVKRVVVCSSNIVLSDQPTEYKFTKRAAEHEVKWFAAKGVSCMGLRPSNIFGSGQSKTEYQMCAFAGLDESFRTKGHFEISGDGTQTRDWVHAGDVARAFELAALSDISGVTLDVCTGIQTSMNEIARMLHVPVKYVDPRPGDAKALISDPKPAADRLQFRAREVLQDRIFDAFPSVPREVSA